MLLISPRPADGRIGYIDHRVSARPLVEALGPLGDLVELDVLEPPTFRALAEKLERAVHSASALAEQVAVQRLLTTQYPAPPPNAINSISQRMRATWWAAQK